MTELDRAGGRSAVTSTGTGGIGARGIEGAARSSCERRRVVARFGIDPSALVARHVPGATSTDELSPFAVEAGARFEHMLYKDACAKLRAVYSDAGLAPFGSADAPIEVPVEVPVEVIVVGDDAGEGRGTEVARTLEALASSGWGVRIVVQGVLELGIGKRVERLRPDVIVGDLGTRRWWVGEAKSYLDRGGETSRAHVGHSCGQLAAGVVALRRVLGAGGTVASSGDLILSSHGRGATVHRLGLGLEIRCIESFLAEADELEDMDPAALFASIDAIDALPAQLRSSCRESCGLYELCTSREVGLSGLSDGTRRVVERLGGLERAERLARGEEEPGPDEIQVVATLRAGFAAPWPLVESGAITGAGDRA